jgi:hypothetical protein
MALFSAKSYKPYVNLMVSSVQHYCTVVMNKSSVFNATSSLSTFPFYKNITFTKWPSCECTHAGRHCTIASSQWMSSSLFLKEGVASLCVWTCSCVCVCVCVCARAHVCVLSNLALPMSAFFKAGESFTPSPVTATMAPIRWHPSTMISFCWGDVRANTISVWYL